MQCHALKTALSVNVLITSVMHSAKRAQVFAEPPQGWDTLAKCPEGGQLRHRLKARSVCPQCVYIPGQIGHWPFWRFAMNRWFPSSLEGQEREKCCLAALVGWKLTSRRIFPFWFTALNYNPNLTHPYAEEKSQTCLESTNLWPSTFLPGWFIGVYCHVINKVLSNN